MTQTIAQGGTAFLSRNMECYPNVYSTLISFPKKFKTKILEGKYANLASLLIPKVDKQHRDDDNHINVNINTQKDPCLSKSLSTSEFITAFGNDKMMMCMKFADRRVDLDKYEANIVEVCNNFWFWLVVV